MPVDLSPTMDISLEDSLTLAPEGWEWVIAHVRPRCEKKLQAHCERIGHPVYLPLRKKAHRYGARLREFWSPLFPGYVFCVVPSMDRSSLRQNEYVANVLPVVEPESLLIQLRQIRQALAADNLVDVMPYLEKGRAVRVTGGALKGIEGIVEKIGAKTKVVINIELIRRSVFVEVDSMYIEPL